MTDKSYKTQEEIREALEIISLDKLHFGTIGIPKEPIPGVFMQKGDKKYKLSYKQIKKLKEKNCFDNDLDKDGSPHNLPVRNDLPKRNLSPLLKGKNFHSLVDLLEERDGFSFSDIKTTKSEGELSNSTQYLKTNLRSLAKNFDKVTEIFNDKIVVDIGAGESSRGYELAVLAGARAYIGVEPNHAGILSGSIVSAENFDKDKFIPYSIADTDMLSFLRCVKDSSISILASGIDDFIISDNNYCHKVNQEIARTLSPEGGMLSIMSEIYFPKKEKRFAIDGYPNRYIGSSVSVLYKDEDIIQ